MGISKPKLGVPTPGQESINLTTKVSRGKGGAYGWITPGLQAAG